MRVPKRPRIPRGSRGESGLTLIELMIASFLAMVVVLGMASFQASIGQFFREGSERLRLQQNVHRTSLVMAIGLRKAAKFEIYDPVDPSKVLLAGPAVRFKDSNDAIVGGYRLSGDHKALLDGSNRRVDDMTVKDLWFESGAEGSLQLTLALSDKYRNESALTTEISPRN